MKPTPPTPPPAPLSVHTATRSEISALNDDNLLAFWLKANQEFNRLVWGSSADFRRTGLLVELRLEWSRAEIDHRLRQSSVTSTPRADT